MSPRFLGLAALLLVLLQGCQPDGAPEAVTSTAAPPPPPITISIGGASGRALPADFLGFSIEFASLSSPLLDPANSNLGQLMKNLGPGRLRVGGNSVDGTAAWVPDGGVKPAWAATAVTSADLDRLGRLARATGWTVDLAVGLGHPDPARAANEVVTAVNRLGTTLSSVQIGNEPDHFVLMGLRSPGYDYTTFHQEYVATRAAIRNAAPTVPISGPSTSSTAWLGRFLADERTTTAFATQHHYALSVCDGTAPTIDQLLSPDNAQAESSMAAASVATAAQYGLRLRLNESNSVSCGGQPGVSDTFGSSLWAVDSLMRAARAGVSGANLHTGGGECASYSPFCAAPGSTTFGAQPIYYGLLLVHQLGVGQVLDVSVSGASDKVSAYAVQRSDGSIAIAIVNMDDRVGGRTAVKIAGRSGQATVVRLKAPSLAATTDVSLGGRTVDGKGTIAPVAEQSPINADGSVVDVEPASSLLVTIPR